jgi:hypothetical protein
VDETYPRCLRHVHEAHGRAVVVVDDGAVREYHADGEATGDDAEEVGPEAGSRSSLRGH